MSSVPPRGSSRRRIAGERRTAPSRAPEMTGDALDRPVPSDRPVPPDAGPEPAAGVGPAAATPAAERPAAARPPRSAPSALVLAVLGALALVLVVAAVVLGTFVWSYGQVRHDDKVEEAGRTASAAAERAAVPILSYGYRSLPADQKAAEAYMTPSYRKQYDASFTKLVVPNAPKLHARVSASVKASGVMQPAATDRVDVLVYVNQTTTSTANGGEPQVALNRAKFSMVRSGSGSRWLVDKIVSY